MSFENEPLVPFFKYQVDAYISSPLLSYTFCPVSEYLMGKKRCVFSNYNIRKNNVAKRSTHHAATSTLLLSIRYYKTVLT